MLSVGEDGIQLLEKYKQFCWLFLSTWECRWLCIRCWHSV